MRLHSLAKHGGIHFVGDWSPLVTRELLGNVRAHNLVRNERRSRALDVHISDYFWHRRMVSGFSLRSVLAQVDGPSYRGPYLASFNKVILDGAAGDRARNHLRKGMEFSEESIDLLRTYFGEPTDPSSLLMSDAGTDEVWIAAKNYFNFFHFTAESLHKAYMDDERVSAASRISFLTKNGDISNFINAWISSGSSLFSAEVGARMFADVVPAGPVLMPMSSKHLLYQLEGPHHAEIDAARPAGWSWTGFDATPHPMKILSLNSYDSTLVNFRNQMINLAKSHVKNTWGRKIYVARSPDIKRQRVMGGEAELIAKLQSRGFEVVYFENLSPLEQVRCVSGAKCIVMQHGAGMTNMLFANDNAHVIEIGTYQTALARWGDFIPLASVSGCHYHTVFAEMDYPDEETDPVFAEHGLVAPMLDADGIDRILEIVSSAMKDKRSGRLAGVMAHADYFIGREAFNQTYRLLDAVGPKLAEEHDYWVKRADVAKACNHVAEGRRSLLRALELNDRSETRRRYEDLVGSSEPNLAPTH